MNAALFTEFRGPLAIERLDDPAPTPTGAVIRVEATGICRSDWHGWMGHDPGIRLPHVPGHEWAGVIEAVGRDVTRFRPGDRVTAPFVCGCGSCAPCREGDPQVCLHQFQPGFTAWGSFAEFVMIEFADFNLVPLPDDLGFVAAASLGCRFATSFRAVAHQARVQPGQWVAVHGCGGVGVSAITIASALGARVVAVDLNADALATAKEAGAEGVIHATAGEDVPAHIIDHTRGGAHVSIDACGSAVTSQNSINSLRPRGKHVQIGLMTGADAEAAVPMARVIADELELYGTHGMQAARYPDMFAFLVAHGIDPMRLVGATIPLGDAPAALTTGSAFAPEGITVIHPLS